MALLDPKERSARGLQQQLFVTAKAESSPQTLFQSSWRDYIFAEVWTRPGLDLRSRYLIVIAGAAAAGSASTALDGYIRGALKNQELSLAELREAALHFAVYGGWHCGAVIDDTTSRMAHELGLTFEDYPPIRTEPWDPTARLQQGAEEFVNVMTFSGPPPVSPYFEGGILNFVFGEMWHRKGLCQRSRRWLTLVGVCESMADIPIRTHIYGAMACGNTTPEEMQEFVLQYAIHAGWPKASVIQGVVFDISNKIKNGLTWDGKPKE